VHPQELKHCLDLLVELPPPEPDAVRLGAGVTAASNFTLQRTGARVARAPAAERGVRRTGERGYRLELIMNLRTAKAVGLTTPGRCCCGPIR
jgi:hypothetical protein